MKIPPKDTNRTYELTCLITSEYTKAELDDIKSKLQKTIEKNKGKVQEIDEWGKKELAYTIKKEGKSYDEAFFLHFVLEVDAEQATSIKEAMNIEDEVIRYLLVRREE